MAPLQTETNAPQSLKSELSGFRVFLIMKAMGIVILAVKHITKNNCTATHVQSVTLQ